MKQETFTDIAAQKGKNKSRGIIGAEKATLPQLFAPMGALNQTAAREGLPVRIRFARANIIFRLAVCLTSPRYRVRR